MMVRVVMSNATRVPAVSFSLSTLFRQPTTYLGPLLAFTMTACRAAVRAHQKRRWRNITVRGKKSRCEVIEQSQDFP